MSPRIEQSRQSENPSKQNRQSETARFAADCISRDEQRIVDLVPSEPRAR
jgi:hypothetical protein